MSLAAPIPNPSPVEKLDASFPKAHRVHSPKLKLP
jgi:hypothetical protein